MIFQGFNLLEQRNVLKNVCYPLEIAGVKKADAEKKAKELIEMVGLSDRLLSYPSQLSGGQKQRVAIARALATDPKYILCDEATSALDPNTTQSILELLKQINKTMGVTIVVITHEMKVIEQICDRVAVIDKSQIAESGKVSTVFANPKSDIAKELILPKSKTDAHITGKKSIRLVFDGEKSRRSIIADMILSTQVRLTLCMPTQKILTARHTGICFWNFPTTKCSRARFLHISIQTALHTKRRCEPMSEMFHSLWQNGIIQLGIWETVYMTLLSTIVSYVIGLPLGIMLSVTDKDGICPVLWLNRIVGFIVNIFRSIPFIILMVALLPVAKLVVGTSFGNKAMVVVLIIAAAPYVARMVESSIKEVDKGIIEAAQAMGTSTGKIITKVLIPEAKPSLIIGGVISMVTILSYSAMAATIGGGGLGQIAITYGYQRYNNDIIWICVVLTIIIVQIIQEAGAFIAHKTDKRIK